MASVTPETLYALIWAPTIGYIFIVGIFAVIIGTR